MQLSSDDVVNGCSCIFGAGNGNGSIRVAFEVGDSGRWHRQNLMDEAFVREEVRFVKGDALAEPLALQIRAANVDLAVVEKRAAEDTIVFDIVIVEDEGLD